MLINQKSESSLQPWKAFAGATLLLTLAFSLPLYQLIRFTMNSEMYSHVLLIPFISAYLIWLKKDHLSLPAKPAPALSAIGLLAGLAMLIAVHPWSPVPKMSQVDYLAGMVASFLFLLFALAAGFLGKKILREFAFPAGFLLFCIPFPVRMENWIQSFLQQSSAVVAHGFFILSGTSVFNEGTLFRLPGISLEVAPECSGIHSTTVLFIVSLLAGHLFLRKGWKCVILLLSVIVLGILRNAVRILVIGLLCVHIDPRMIDSPIHRQGGPLFFALSLVPLFLLLWILWKTDQAENKPKKNSTKQTL